MRFDDLHRREDGDSGGSYWRQWIQPPTVITIVVAVATVYGTFVLQAERLDALRAEVAAVKQDYQRRDVLAEQLRNINDRLYNIEVKLSSQGRPR